MNRKSKLNAATTALPSDAPNYRDVKFYVEAKKPHGDIATPDNYFQTIRYGWSSSTPIAVLHDFEQLEILDCRYRPHIDTALAQNLRKYHFSQYKDSEKCAETPLPRKNYKPPMNAN